MLTSLHIKNLALIDTLTLEFGEGFNVLTGETGAGKSVITGAIGLLTGGRADKGMIRQGTDRCELSAIFQFPATFQMPVSILQESGISTEIDHNTFELHLRRTITQSGTRNYVNDTPVTAQLLNRLGDAMIDIHAANQHYSLNSTAVQLALLDGFCGLDPEKAQCAAAYAARQDAEKKKNTLLKTILNPSEADHLRSIVQEIESAELHTGEDEETTSQYAVAANAREIQEITGGSAMILQEGDDAVVERLTAVRRMLERLAHLDPAGGQPLCAACTDLCGRLHEFAHDLEHYGRQTEVDEERLNYLNERLTLIQKLKRRYGPTLDNVLSTLTDAQTRLDTFENAADHLAALDQALTEADAALRVSALALREKRKSGAVHLAKKVTAMLNKLGFLKAVFDVEFSETVPGANGADKIEFLFSANPGENAGALRSFASSGEMSRVMLAIKAVLSAADSVPVLLFDEIDVNIGGETASVVGHELRKLAKGRQVVCISHLAQVAVQAETHIRVRKSVSGERTLTHADILDTSGRTDEIGRMLGGGAAALRHATELLAPLHPIPHDQLFNLS